jgi:hypothetical protein
MHMAPLWKWSAGNPAFLDRCTHPPTHALSTQAQHRASTEFAHYFALGLPSRVTRESAGFKTGWGTGEVVMSSGLLRPLA